MKSLSKLNLRQLSLSEITQRQLENMEDIKYHQRDNPQLKLLGVNRFGIDRESGILLGRE